MEHSSSHWPHPCKLIDFLCLLPRVHVIRMYGWPQSLMGLRLYTAPYSLSSHAKQTTSRTEPSPLPLGNYLCDNSNLGYTKLIICFSDPARLLFQNSEKNNKLVLWWVWLQLQAVRMCSTLIVGVNWNSLVAPEMLSGELSSCADNGYLLLKFLIIIFIFISTTRVNICG